MADVPRILLAGCNAYDVNCFREALSDFDCWIETVALGTDCLNQLQRFQPHLVLLDNTITELDAFALCRRIKNDHTAMVMMVTALNELDDIRRAVDAGTDDFISKPINKNEVRKRTENLLKLHESLKRLN